jgi:hypothetical protein
MRCEMRHVSVSDPVVIGMEKPEDKAATWAPPELEGMNKGQIHAYYEQLGHDAAARGEEELKDAHKAWVHGWAMEMEGREDLST